MSTTKICKHCGKEYVRDRPRGLCSACYRNPDIRMDYPLLRWRGTFPDLVEDLETLLSSGTSLEETLSRLDYDSATLYKRLHRRGRLDLWERLVENEPNIEHRRRSREATPGRVAERRQRAEAKAARLAKVGA